MADGDFREFRSVFHTAGLDDPALLNALMFKLAFAVAGGERLDTDCLMYKGQAIDYICRRMADPQQALTEATFGAILFLVGVEVRLPPRTYLPIYALYSWYTHLRARRTLIYKMDSEPARLLLASPDALTGSSPTAEAMPSGRYPPQPGDKKSSLLVGHVPYLTKRT